MKVYYIARSSNRKTGNIINQYIGRNLEESRKSCSGCKLLEDKTCYSTYGTPAMAYSSIQTAYKKDKNRYSLKNALKNRSKEAKYVRLGAIGDSSSISNNTILNAERQIRKAGLGVLNYTHFWKSKGAHLVKKAMASCDSWSDVLVAIKKGWRTTLIESPDFLEKNGTHGVHKGHKWLVCPAQSFKNKEVTCNTCGLCDAQKTHISPIIVFLKH